jgi:RNA polymerase sigma-70 factor (ECF subfamily)
VVKIIIDDEFKMYIEQYSKLIFTICCSFIGDYFDAQDLTQETFLAAYKSRASFKSGNVKAWLTTIAANKCKDYLKNSSRRATCVPPEDFTNVQDEQGGAEDQFFKEQTEQKVYYLCQKLKEPYRTISLIHFCENKSISEISLQSGVKIKTLQTQIYRAKQMLQRLWDEELA